MEGTMSSTMTMPTGTPSSGSAMSFTGGAGETLWIAPFVPTTDAAVFGACVLLFFLAILTRFLDGMHRSLTMRWTRAANVAVERKRALQQTGSSTVPFLLSSDIPRGALFFLQAGLSYLLMLAVMTYNGYYFVSILLGLGVGETFFGRFGRPSPAQNLTPMMTAVETTPLAMHRSSMTEETKQAY